MAKRFIGESIARLEDQRFLTGRGRYIDDTRTSTEAAAALVRSDHAHAAIIGINADAALAMPGVLGIHTETDLSADGLGALPCAAAFEALSPLVVPPRYALARGHVRHVGDPVALVVAESADAAAAAAELVEVEYRVLPVTVDARAALAPGAPVVWPEAPGNLAFHFEKGEREATAGAMRAAAHVVQAEIVNHRVSAAPMETRGGVGSYDAETSTFTLECNAQGVHGVHMQIARDVFRVPPEQVRVHAPDVGGGFGLKNFLYPEWILLLWAARRHARPVRWLASRGEDFVSSAYGRDVWARAALALDDDGRFLALDADVVANLGAYLSSGGPNITTRAMPTAMGGIYAIPHIYMQSRGGFTNTVPVDAYRGAGKPEANFLVERLIDIAARRLGMDPIELRQRNVVSAFPYQKALGVTLDGGRFGDNIDAALRFADHAGFAARRDSALADGRLRGFGAGCFLETSRGATEEGAEICFAPDGMIELRVGTESQGQGHETAFAQIAAERFGLPLSTFRYVQADTGTIRMGHGHGGARTMHMGGKALVMAIDEVLAKARVAAAALLQSDAGSLVYADGRFAAGPDGASVDLLDVASAARDGDGAPLDTFALHTDAEFTFPNGCHIAEVEIDADTGALTIERYLIVDDYGRLVNPVLTEGQVHGGVVQGIGQAIGEAARHDPESGQLLSASFMDYHMPRAREIPTFETHLDGLPTNANPLGVKGSGQAGCIAAPQTIMNAVLDALAPLGIEHVDMPATSETLWRAMRAAAS